MKLITKYPDLFFRFSVIFSTVIRVLLNLTLVLICAALMVGVYKSGLDLYHSVNKPLEYILQHMLLDAIFVVALVEIAITILGYLKDGRVHVRYIVDTILIIMLNEIVTMWFDHPSLDKMIGLSVIVVSLALVRISTIKFAAHDDQALPGKEPQKPSS